MKPNTVEWFLKHGVERILPEDGGLEKMLTGKKPIKAYLGMDATGKLHLGHALMLKKLGELQKLGHEVIVLIGGFTSLIGDPTDKTSARKQQTREEVEEHAKSYLPLIGRFIDLKKATIKNNADWYAKMDFAKVMEISSHFTVQQMLERDMFEKRIHGSISCGNCGKNFTNIASVEYISPTPKLQEEGTGKLTINSYADFLNQTCPYCFVSVSDGIWKGGLNIDRVDPSLDRAFQSFIANNYIRPKPIYLHEFFYPLMQGYDSVELDVDLEIGGNDQTFNMLAGRDLLKDYKGKSKYVLAHKLLVDENGKKMGKTDGNGINLDDSPNDIFGKIMSWPDNMIMPAYELLTDYLEEELKEIRASLEKNNPMVAKLSLAREVTAWLYDDQLAATALENFTKVFQKNEKPEHIETIEIEDEIYPLYNLLQEIKCVESGNEAKTLIQQGAIRVNDEVIMDYKYMVDVNTDKPPVLIQKGKRYFVHVKGV